MLNQGAVVEVAEQGGAMRMETVSNQHFRTARRMLDLTQIQVAKEIGIDQGSLSNFEKGRRPLTERNRKKLVTFLQRRMQAVGIRGSLESVGMALQGR